jgi:DNA-binding NarL/FixJ family response regulator
MTPGLLDRDAEARALSAELAAAARPGHGSVVVITGSLGTGRSALLNLAAGIAAAGGLRVRRTAGARLERNFGLCLAQELLCPLLPGTQAEHDRGAARDLLARSALSSSSALLSGEETPGEHRMALDSVALAIEAAARHRPLALLVDDLQWCDEPSLRVLARLALLARAAPVALVLTVLDGDAGSDRALIRAISALASTTLRLAPLSADSAATLIARNYRVPAGGDGADAERLRRECGGIPLLLAARLAEAAGDRGHGQPADWTSVHERISATLAAQPPATQKYAVIAALVGHDADPDLTARLADLDPVEAARARSALTRLGLFGPRTADLMRRYLRDVAKERLPSDDLETLRLQAAAMMYDDGASAQRIVESLPFAPQSATWVADLILSAADAARASGDMDTTARALRLALRVTDPPAAARGALLAQLAAAEFALGEIAAVRHLSEAMSSLPDPGDAAAAAAQLPAAAFASAPYWLGDQLLASATCLSAGTREDPAPPVVLGTAARILSARHGQARRPPLPPWVTAVRPDPRLLTWADRELEAVLLKELALSGAVSAREVAARAGRLVSPEPVSTAQLHAMLPLVLPAWYAAEDAPLVLTWLETVAAQDLAYPSQADELMILAARAALRVRCGYLADAVSLAERACGDISRGVRCQGRSAWVFYGVALTAQDGRLTRKVLSAFRPRDEHGGLLESSFRQLLEAVAMSARNPRQAVARVEGCGRRLERVGWRNPALFPWRLLAAYLHQRLAEPELATSRILEHIELAKTWGAPACAAHALRARARITPDHCRQEYLLEALALVADSRDQLERAKVLMSLADALPPGDAAVAGYLREATSLAERCGAAGLVAQGRKQLAREGILLGREGGSLTSAEWRVAMLAARGQSNSAIAAELGITKRAVEKHLTSCYRKLNIEGKQDLAAVVGDHAGHSRI